MPKPRSVRRWAARFGTALVLTAAAGYGVGMGLADDKRIRRLLAGDPSERLHASRPFELRGVLLEQRDAALAAGDQVEAATINGVLAQEAILRARALHEAWMGRRDPDTSLFPESADVAEWTYEHTAADFFCFQLHAALYTGEPTVGPLLETLRAEASLSEPGALPGPVSSDTGEPIGASESERLFGASEYAKDGLLNLYERYGDAEVYARLVEVLDAVVAHSRHPSRFGPIPDKRSEVNGELLQVLSRVSLVAADRPAYAELAARIADAVVEQMLAANHGLPAHTFDYESDEVERAKAQFRDHGNEVVGGLSEVYALAVSRRSDPSWAERADRWAEPIARMFEIILEHGVNQDGLLINQLDPATLEPMDPYPSDNWGYVLSGLLLFTEAAERHGAIEPARLEAMRAGADAIIAAVARTNGLAWEGASHDGFADSIESALYVAAHRPSAGAGLLPWADRQIGIMFGMQRDDGFVTEHYLDGNFIRTALMYADLRSGGWRVEPWNPGTRVGVAFDRGRGEAVLVVESDAGYEGRLVYPRRRHALLEAMPWDWPRLNSWPEWLPPHRVREAVVAEGNGETRSPAALGEGWPVRLGPGERLAIRVRLAPPEGR